MSRDSAERVRPRTWLQPWSPLNVALFVALALVTWRTAFATVPLPGWLRLVGLLLALTSGAWMLWAAVVMGRNLTYLVETWREQTLVTTGPFAIVRHPIYLGLITGWIGAGLALASWLMVLIGIAVVAPAEVARARLEEALLERRFGEAYRAYRGRVPMLLPRPR